MPWNWIIKEPKECSENNEIAYYVGPVEPNWDDWDCSWTQDKEKATRFTSTSQASEVCEGLNLGEEGNGPVCIVRVSGPKKANKPPGILGEVPEGLESTRGPQIAFY